MSVKSNTNAQMGVEYQFNNADKVLKNLETKMQNFDGKIHALFQNGSVGTVTISEANIRNNSQFIVDLWDWAKYKKGAFVTVKVEKIMRQLEREIEKCRIKREN